MLRFMCMDPIHPALMGEGVAWFASQHGRNRYERSRSEYSHSVTVRANRARKPSQPGGFAYFCRSKSMRLKDVAKILKTLKLAQKRHFLQTVTGSDASCFPMQSRDISTFSDPS